MLDSQDDLEFEQFLRDKAAEAKRAVKFSGTTFIKMLGTGGGYQTALALISRRHPSDGFSDLVTRGRPDLTVEALVVESKWRACFPPLLIEKAEKLLRQAGYSFVRFSSTTVFDAAEAKCESAEPLGVDAVSAQTEVDAGANLSALDDLDVLPSTHAHSRTMGTVSVFRRDPAVRSAVIARARGRCEYCGTSGFEMSDGTAYLEAHHIIGLAKEGPDTTGNVIALCALHHKQAHYGRDAATLEAQFLEILFKYVSK